MTIPEIDTPQNTPYNVSLHIEHTHPTENLISRLLMGFVERNISAQTIADMVRAQIVEEELTADVLSPHTANAVIEVLTNAQNNLHVYDIVLFLSNRKDFPSFLSERAIIGALMQFIRVSQAFYASPEQIEQKRFLKHLAMLCSTATYRNDFSALPRPEKTKLALQVRSLPENIQNWLQVNVPHLGTLLTLLQQDKIQSAHTQNRIYNNCEEIVQNILISEEQFLIQKGTRFFQTYPQDMMLQWKAHNLNILLKYCEDDNVSIIKKTFLAEWFFDGLLQETMNNSNFVGDFHAALNFIFNSELNYNETLIKGTLRALQKDLCDIFNKHGESDIAQNSYHRAEYVFYLLIPFVEKYLPLFTKNIIAWSLQTPVHPAAARLLTRQQWLWLRTLVTQNWEEELKHPPYWVVQHANRFTALIFRIASHIWLQEYAHILLEKLYNESLSTSFVMSQKHIDYTEFLARVLRKKSPIFASRMELLYALKLLGKATPSEESQISIFQARFKLTSRPEELLHPERKFWNNVLLAEKEPTKLGPNAVARALYMIHHVTRTLSETLKKTDKIITT